MCEEGVVITRRSLLRAGWRALATTGIAGALPTFHQRTAAAKTGAFDRALVCIYLFGGNDSNNLIVPMERSQYDTYARTRGNLAVPFDALLPVTAARSQRAYGFHPALAELRDLYNSRVLAVIANVGSLAQPVTKAAYLAGTAALPGDWMRHNDESLGYLPGGFAVPGWAARLAGLKLTAPNPNALAFDSGTSMVLPAGFRLPPEEEPNALLARAMAGAAHWITRFPATSLGRQLQQVASLLQAGPQMGMSQQICFCPLGGFDTHIEQAGRQAASFRQLSEAMAAFYDATVEMGIAQRVITFTETEFNRTLLPNRKNGTEHGWGGHQIVMGGPVLGGDVYGDFPALALNGPDDAGAAGVWIPTTSKDQVAATLANWFGVRLADLPGLLPRLGSFRAPTLEFLT